MSTTLSRTVLSLLVAGGVSGLTLPERADAQSQAVTEYQAGYEVRYNGRRVAAAEFSVARVAGAEYEFRSSTRARGLLRLASPNPAIELSRFSVDAGRLAPSSYRYEDGSRKGEDNFAIAFEPSTQEILITGTEVDMTLPYEPDLLDRGLLQVALVHDLNQCRAPGPYRYVDDDGVRTYRYSQLEDLTIETDIGAIETVRFLQEREGSSRRTLL